MSNDSKYNSPEEMTMASEADGGSKQPPKATIQATPPIQVKPAPQDDFGEMGTMASEAGLKEPQKPAEEFGEMGTMASEAGVGAPAPKGSMPTMASMPGNSTPNTSSGKAAKTKGADFKAEDLIGTELNSYKILKKIAEGGMGVVLLGEHSLIGRRGAIKILKPEFCQDEAVVQRFYQEARAVNTIQHENIVDIYDFGRMDNGGVYFIMEYLDGEPLSSRVKDGPLSFVESLPILEQTLRALKAAHDKGFIHRDLKPDNIFLVKRDGTPQVKILDFGIAKLAGLESAQEKLTRTGSIIGTPHYMSPEQIEGSEVDLRTDIYAMGVIMYELWTGDTPFKGETLGQVIKGHLMVQAPRLENLKPDLRVPAKAAEIVEKALEKDREKRYKSAAELLADLQAAAKAPFTPITAKPKDTETNRPQRAKSTPPPTGSATLVEAPRQEAQRDTNIPPPPPPKPSYTLPIIGGLAAVAAVVAFLVWPKGDTNNDPTKKPVPVCGNKTIEAGESCDDGNKTNGDGCNEGCTIESAKVLECPEDLDKCDLPKIRKDMQVLLRNSLEQTDPKVRSQGSEALGDLKDKESVPALLTRAESDPDAEVKAQAAGALGLINDNSALSKLQELAKVAEGPLQPWFFGAAARLGDASATKSLEKILTDATNRISAAVKANKPVEQVDCAIALQSATALTDISKPGNPKVEALLTKLAPLEVELGKCNPQAGTLIASSMARLGNKNARSALEGLLSHEDESIRINAAEMLARLGDNAGHSVLTEALNSSSSANKLIAARVLVSLGDYSGYDVLVSALQKEKDPELKQLAAEGLGKIGERDSMKLLIPVSSDESWSIKLASAVALVAIIGLDPQFLAAASADWVAASLKAGDVASRKAAANIIGELPKKQAMPLLLTAIVDSDPQVRKAALKSGAKIKKDPEVTKAIADAVIAEADLGVKEEGVKALGDTKDPSAIPTLKKEFLPDPGRVGVFAAGSLAELGDADGRARLQEAANDPKLRAVAIEAAIASEDTSIIDVLVPATADPSVNVRFLAAESIASYAAKSVPEAVAQKETIRPVLEEGLKSKDPAIQVRAITALQQIGVTAAAPMKVEDYLDSSDPAVRLSAIPLIVAMDAKKGLPLMRRLLSDSEVEIRLAVLDALTSFIGPQRENVQEVLALYKFALDDIDGICRSKAQAAILKLSPDGVAQKPITNPKPAFDKTFEDAQKDLGIVPPPIPESIPASTPVSVPASVATSAPTGDLANLLKNTQDALAALQKMETDLGTWSKDFETESKKSSPNANTLGDLKDNIKNAPQLAQMQVDAINQNFADAELINKDAQETKDINDTATKAQESLEKIKKANKDAMGDISDFFTDQSVKYLGSNSLAELQRGYKLLNEIAEGKEDKGSCAFIDGKIKEIQGDQANAAGDTKKAEEFYEKAKKAYKDSGRKVDDKITAIQQKIDNL